jgi:hypothetical protein
LQITTTLTNGKKVWSIFSKNIGNLDYFFGQKMEVTMRKMSALYKLNDFWNWQLGKNSLILMCCKNFLGRLPFANHLAHNLS